MATAVWEGKGAILCSGGKAALWFGLGLGLGLGLGIRVRVRVSHHDIRAFLLLNTNQVYLVEGVGGVADHMQLRRRKTQPLLHLVSIPGYRGD